MPPISKKNTKTIAMQLSEEGLTISDIESLIKVKNNILQANQTLITFDKFKKNLNDFGSDKLKQLAEDSTSHFKRFIQMYITGNNINILGFFTGLDSVSTYIKKLNNTNELQFLNKLYDEYNYTSFNELPNNIKTELKTRNITTNNQYKTLLSKLDGCLIWGHNLRLYNGGKKKKKTSKKKVRKIHKGPRGGKYYISKGRKVYI